MRIFKVFCLICALIVILSFSAFASAPVILSQPTDYYFPEWPEQGEIVRASFSVLASGEDLSYMWQVCNTSTDGIWKDATNFSGYNTSTLTPRIIESQSNGRLLFRCIVTSNEGSVTSDAVTVSVGMYLIDSLPQLLNFIHLVANSVFAWASDICSCIVSEPLLLFTVGFLAVGASIGIASRLMSRS